MTVRAEAEVTLARVDDGTQGADGTTFTPSVSASGDISWTNDGGKTNPPTQNIMGPEGDEGPAGKSAYQSAVDGGYSGTEAEFNSDLSQVSDITQHFWYDADGAHVAEVDQDTFTQNPQGPNSLIDSNGMDVRDGLDSLAHFGDGARVGRADGARVDIVPSRLRLVTNENVTAFDLQSAGNTETFTVELTYADMAQFGATYTPANRHIVGPYYGGATPFSITWTDAQYQLPPGTTVAVTEDDVTDGEYFDLWTFVSGTNKTEVADDGYDYIEMVYEYNNGTHTITLNNQGPSRPGSGQAAEFYGIKFDKTVISPLTQFTGAININNMPFVDFVTEEGTENGWTYRKWASGKRECWLTMSYTGNLSTSNGGWYCDSSSGRAVANFPTGLFTSKPFEFSSAVCDGSSTNVDTCIMGANRSLTNFGNVLLHRGSSYTTSRTYIIYLHAIQL